ncbi:FHA domain-containing protein [Thermincola potens]|uniref:FHA domain containing protein n=1 Tax=Thermincola potens (strain JR) TaxID=635013 RepID=D5X7S0_THEPJ|nr:FHA domain-containing protein [Thermincola potens]ADG82640.1 FHA domain containing protein [Thermincola potens JR]
MNSPWIFLGMKFVVLFFIYLFVFKVVAMIARDIKGKTSGGSHEQSLADYAGQELGEAYGLMAIQSIVDDIKVGMQYPVKRYMQIGRSAENSLRINDAFVSHEHARIYYRDGRYWIEDLNSRNGTLLDGKRIDRPVPLDEGALLSIGGVTFKVVRWENESG